MSTEPSISHNELVAAVAATGDLELAAWVEDEEGYILRSVPELALTGASVARVVVLEASIPLSFLVARCASGELVVTTSQAKGVYAVLAGLQPEEVTGAVVFALVREESRHQTLQSVPRLSKEDGAWDILLKVSDEANGDEDWELHLSADTSTLTKRAS